MFGHCAPAFSRWHDAELGPQRTVQGDARRGLRRRASARCGAALLACLLAALRHLGLDPLRGAAFAGTFGGSLAHAAARAAGVALRSSPDPEWPGDSTVYSQKETQTSAREREVNSWYYMMKDKIKMSKDDAVRQAMLDASTPVPESFEAASRMAAQAARKAADEGHRRQTVYVNMAGVNAKESQEFLEEGAEFAWQLASDLVATDPSARVQLLFDSAGTLAQCQDECDALPEGVASDVLPDLVPDSPESATAMKSLARFLDAQWVIVAAPTVPSLSAARTLVALADDADDRNASILFVNANQAGNLTADLDEVGKQTFFAAQYDLGDEEGAPLNTAVVAMAWPQCYSCWEDNPEDPDALEGGWHFLRSVQGKPPRPKQVQFMLLDSRVKWQEKNRWNK